MKTQVRKWGNRAVVSIPKPLLKAVGLKVGSPIGIRVVGKHLVIVPVREGEYGLDTLLSGITPDNLHGEVAFARAAGREAG